MANDIELVNAKKPLNSLYELLDFLTYASLDELDREERKVSPRPTANSVPVTLLVSGSLISGNMVGFIDFAKSVFKSGDSRTALFSMPFAVTEYLTTSQDNPEKRADYVKEVREILDDEDGNPKNIYLQDVSLFMGSIAVNLPTLNIALDRVEGWMPGKVTSFTHDLG